MLNLRPYGLISCYSMSCITFVRKLYSLHYPTELHKITLTGLGLDPSNLVIAGVAERPEL